MRKRFLLAVLICAGAAAAARAGEPPAATEQMTFHQAVAQAVQRNPSVQQAAAEILRAQALLQQARSATLPSLDGTVSNSTLNTGVSFNGITAQPQNQTTMTVSLSALLYAPVAWAEKTQAADNAHVARLSDAEVKRQVAVATAQAYLAVIARRRIYDADVRARDTAKAHYELARTQLEAGTGSRLNELRAQQAVSADEVLVQQAAQSVYAAQEALGVLVAANHAVDTDGEPTLDTPASVPAAQAAMPGVRTDLLLATARVQAARRVYDDSWKDRLPSVSALFTPEDIEPASAFQKARSWRLTIVGSVPIFDGGLRSAEKAQRLALLDEQQYQQQADVRQAQSDVRTAEAAVKSAEQALVSARAAAEQARQVVQIVDVSFRAGASTNIEVIDAQQASLDADTAAAQAEDQLREAKLSLLVALGLFP
ncbi:MAG: TolC family protein [Acidobacteriota bacterium]|nr:TolC family protein [Acidobacteriota bacterium]